MEEELDMFHPCGFPGSVLSAWKPIRTIKALNPLDQLQDRP